MRFTLILSVALGVSASALPRFASEQDLGLHARKNGGKGKNSTKVAANNAAQTSLKLDPRVISKSFEQDGSANATKGQVASLTSSNNFINFCLTVNKPLTNGQQIKGGSCNTAPMGVIAPSTNMPSSKFVSPENLSAVKANTSFEIKMAVKHLETGHFTNAESTYFAAPQQLNGKGDIIGHTHFVIEQLNSITSKTPSNPSKFAFFKGVNTAADAQGNVAVNVSGGLPPGVYKLSSINTSANHAPVLVAVAQHGHLDDQVYFFVTDDGKRPAKIV
ncbi:hypothetical protein F5148DRAFT_1184332 [Russula earlei]|uniref:Uncharacterized protein n=1 Tax=Russula earlei TaxID=71964 RepID=A0ACC0UDS2_9AGAM|nr:hypothetical protein F5148DRAFT_1184332 [Russula earlei]